MTYYFKDSELDEAFKLFRCVSKDKCCQIVLTTMDMYACRFNGAERDIIFEKKD